LFSVGNRTPPIFPPASQNQYNPVNQSMVLSGTPLPPGKYPYEKKNPIGLSQSLSEAADSSARVPAGGRHPGFDRRLEKDTLA
jgi:hypothetical protein